MTRTREENAQDLAHEPHEQEFTVRYRATEITIEEVVILASSKEEALRVVEEYEFDNSGSNFVNSIEYSVSDAEIVEEGA